ncbi:MAG TPA: hypothetical protein VNE39_22770 [Planctomycetota bacterium]|nr:hypothetical protein [Planctomycetota bacterium]
MASARFGEGSERGRYTEQECQAVPERMFPAGLGSEDILRELAPDGWAGSPLFAVFHPSAERLLEEALAFFRNAQRLSRREGQSERPEPTLESVRESHLERPVEPTTECQELVAMCLWDVFSDSHEVIAADGRLVDLGSFRGAAGTLADFVNQHAEAPRYDYIDFYLGTFHVGGRADLTPAYEMIFRRLRSQGLDWVYSFPRLYAVDMRPLREALKEGEDQEPEWASYDPSKSLAAEQEQREHDAGVQRLRDQLDEGYREAVERAADQPPPETVAAYHSVYGRLPQGWPPTP